MNKEIIEKLLSQKESWETNLRVAYNRRNNPFYRQQLWSVGMKKEDFDEEIKNIKEEIDRIFNEIKSLT